MIIQQSVYYSQYDKVCLVQFYRTINLITHNHYTSISFSNDMIDQNTIGRWKLKSLKNN